jgi:hypothetical protein
MAMINPDEFADKEVARVYIAGRLSEARRVEQTLSENGVDYAVDAEPFEVRVLGILPSRHEGLAFYVLSGQAEFCRDVLREAGLVVGLVEEELQ